MSRLNSLGNPLTSEGSAFKWLVAVLVAALAVALVAKVISPTAGMVFALILVAIVAVPIVKGVAHMLGSPDDD
ncbi:MAG: hypothetical protein JJE10_06595 [Thermoleophilia bacterium]|nr:hypothetical protein [Thermoleophilia bacterium]